MNCGFPSDIFVDVPQPQFVNFSSYRQIFSQKIHPHPQNPSASYLSVATKYSQLPHEPDTTTADSKHFDQDERSPLLFRRSHSRKKGEIPLQDRTPVNKRPSPFSPQKRRCLPRAIRHRTYKFPKRSHSPISSIPFCTLAPSISVSTTVISKILDAQILDSNSLLRLNC
ncbi:hypothetical protein IQ246_12140 [aff. Roholtiella sp. LEGE 12411]|uniref:hypothetical protein n=1 Tax=aff. Roholtiella sp. LEGE 12411 TaxID=1828822 RepID=UPI00187EF3E6|nr:hypothetical protein [aff. Roholtiella sp. LEGE 12411]MBE9035843.1 hypothetical protein [aff. Roholtiella sp. LEGE 12411]